MRAIATVSLCLSGLALAGCDPSDSASSYPAPEAVTCDATLFDAMKGAPIEDVATLSTGLKVRVLEADAFVTRDFDPNRLTFTTSKDDTVSRIFCG